VAIIRLALGPRTFTPSFWGKLATATYIVTSVVVMYYNFRQEQALIVELFIWAALGVTLISGIDYFLKLRRLINEPEAGPASRV
jgi:phosphatidylglycerophosphate synthase